MFVCKDIPVRMDKGRVRLHRLKGIQHRVQHFIIHFYFQLCLLQDVLIFCHDKADRIAQIMGHLPHRDHGIPVMFQMSHLDFARDIICCVHADDPVQCERFFRMDGEHLCPWVFRAHRAPIDHAVQIDVIGIFTGTQHLLLRVDPLDRLAYTDLPALLMHRKILAEDLRA